ncbi:MAG: hypothetical protein JST44_27515 [Cyanobacteria bacterium SZAS LIN-5]|nr:hypothetical protein [Cyanobacteria bacterium SZAS LIN-5]
MNIQKFGYSVFGGVAGGTVMSILVAFLEHGNFTYGYLLEGLLVGFLLGFQTRRRDFRQDVRISTVILGVVTAFMLSLNANAFSVNLPSLAYIVIYVVISAGFLGGGSWLFAEKMTEEG